MYNMLFIHDREFTDRCWQKYFELLSLLHKKYKATLTPKNWQELKKRYLSLYNQFPEYRNMVVFENDRPIIWADLRVFSPGKPEKTLFLSFHGDFGVMPVEIEKAILKLYLDEMARYECSEAYTTLLNDHLQKYAVRWGAEELCRQDQYYLYRDKANHEVMRSWIDNISSANPNLRMELYDSIPDRIIPEFIRKLERNLREMPQEGRGGMPFNINEEEFKKQQDWHRQNNVVIYNYILFDDNDKIAGTTAVYINRNNLKTIHQLMTGVEKQYRRRGLAKWLKSRMFFKIGEDFPENEIIITEMRAVNDPILSINGRMGYVLERSGKEYKFKSKNLDKYYRQLK